MGDIISVPYKNDMEMSVGLGYILKYVKLRIQNDKNFMCAFIGPTGSGKSLGTLAIMELLFPDKPKQWIVDRVHFMPKDFLDAVTNEDTKSGEVFSFDESGVGQNSKNWMNLVNKMINFTLQTFRYKNLITFFCLPHFTFLDSDTRKLVHAIFETKKIDRKKNVLYIKPKFIQMNHTSGKMYFKYLRVKHNGVLVPIKSVAIPKPSQELIDLYQVKKRSYTKDLYQDILLKVEAYERKQKGVLTPKSNLTEHQMRVLVAYQKNGTFEKAAKDIGISMTAVSGAMSFIKKKLNVASVDDLKKIDLSTLSQ